MGKIAGFLVLRLSLGQCYALARVLAHVIYLGWPRGRRRLRENMRYVLGDDATRKEVNRLAKESLFNYGRYLVDFIRLPAVKPEDIKKRVTLRGWDNLDEALKEGRGAILVGLHSGNWDMVGAAIAQGEYPLNVIGKKNLSTRLNRFVQKRRLAQGMKTVSMDDMEKRVGRMVQVLRRNELLAMAIDVADADKSVAVSFFDAIAKVPRGAATLSLGTEAKIIPVSSVRLADNSILGFIGEHIRFQPSGDYRKDIHALTQRIMTSLEGFVDKHPDQWHMSRFEWLDEAVEAMPHGGAATAE
jgi:KDO2-lipid IV(A) lauroyltransferase